MKIESLKKFLKDVLSRGGSQEEIARRAGVSSTAVSLFLNDKYGAKEDALAYKLAKGMNFYENAWQVVTSVTSYKQVRTAFLAAKRNSAWICISSRSGSGKTQSLLDLYNTCADNSVIYLKCRQWTRKKFLTKLAQVFGVEVLRTADADDLLDAIATEVAKRADKKPLLLLDDAGKLSHSAMQMLIPLYDDNLHRLGAIVAGTETLGRNIKRYVGRIEGYDEIDGRFKRHYISLLGATKKDVITICMANGISEKSIAEDIWNRLPKAYKTAEEGGRSYQFADDLRELSGMIEAEIIKMQIERGELV